MNKETEQLKENVDNWIKQIRKEVDELKYLISTFKEDADEIEYCYKSIQSLRLEMQKVEQDLEGMRLIQIISLKQKVKEEESCKTKLN